MGKKLEHSDEMIRKLMSLLCFELRWIRVKNRIFALD